MSVQLDKMVLIVTGAASGIGRAITARASDQGVKQFVLVDIDEVGLDATADGLDGSADAEIVRADLSLAAASAEIAERAISRFGRIDGLVNAAGITTRASFINGSAETFDQVFAVNARAPYLLMQEAITNMLLRKQSGAIVNIQTINAHCGHPDLAIYAASKGALQTLTKNAANAHVGDGIRVNGINLGWTWTEAEHRMQSEILGEGEDWSKRVGENLPLKRLLEPEEAARRAVYLLGPESAPLTGACIDLEQWIVGAPP